MQNLSREQGNMTKIKREQGNVVPFQGRFPCTDFQVFLYLPLWSADFLSWSPQFYKAGLGDQFFLLGAIVLYCQKAFSNATECITLRNFSTDSYFPTASFLFRGPKWLGMQGCNTLSRYGGKVRVSIACSPSVSMSEDQFSFCP